MKVIRYVLFLAFISLPLGAHEKIIELNEGRVVEWVLKNNFGIKVAETDRAIAKSDVQSSKSIYDTTFNSSLDYLINKNDQAIPLFGTNNKTLNFNIGLSQKLPTGTILGLHWLNRKDTTNSPFATVNPFYDTSIRFDLRQPLLQNRFGLQDRLSIFATKKNYEAVSVETEWRKMELVYQSLLQYWQWVWHQSNVNITRKSAIESKHFEEMAFEKKKLGLFDDGDVLAAQASRLQMENELIESEKNRDESLSLLKGFLNIEPEEKIYSLPSSIPIKENISEEEALRQALQQRKDYQAALLSLEKQDILVAQAKNERWPKLDLVSSLEVNGIDQSYSSGLNEVTRVQHPSYYIGGEFQFPLENRSARSRLEREQLGKAKKIYQLKDLEKMIRREVTDHLRAVSIRQKQVMRNRQIEGLHQKKWQLEIKKFEQGRSSSDLVVRYQEDYLRAQRVTLAAIFQYRVALLELKLAMNSLY